MLLKNSVRDFLLPYRIRFLLLKAQLMHQAGLLEDAEQSYKQILAKQPDHFDSLHLLGLILHQRGKHAEAVRLLDLALKRNPNHAFALNSRGIALRELKRFDEALASFERALMLRPNFVEALSNLGATLHELRRFEEALVDYDRAIKLRPKFVEALSGRGATLNELARFDEALASYDRALTLRPGHAEAHLNEGLTRLLIGDFERGWKKFEWRWQKKRNFTQPLWLGAAAIEDKTILLHCEQGFGDTIQFCRYVPLVARRAGRVILEVQKPLHELMSALPGPAQIVSRGNPLPHFDVHCPLLSLPLAFGTRLESIPSATAYLQAPPHTLQHWKTRLGASDRLRIGICWAGNLNFKGDLSRSVGLTSMLPIFANPDVQFFSLQKDLRKGDGEILHNNRQIIHVGQELATFSDTAAIISLMDLVISSDTAIAHLAGALGKRTWVLLQFVPDWRWLLDRQDNPWYPTVRLFRQDNTRDWDHVVANVQAALHGFVQCRL